MKAKHLLTMMALPALFAACAQEELVKSTAVGLEGRALLDPNFSINVVGEGVDSRFSWNENVWGWNEFTANDKFSAGLVDNLAGGVQNKVLTNYVFSSANAGASYTTTSQMVEGAYFFYSYPEFEKNEASAAVAFDLTSQTKIDLSDAAATVNANQFFVSPIYKLSAGHANIELPLYFVSYWSTSAVKIKNTTGEAFKIRRITLKDAVGKFDVKGTIDMTKFGTNLTYTWSDDAVAYVLPEGKTNAGMLTADIASATTQQEVITVDCQAYELANGAEATAYIQVPAGRHTNDVAVEVVIETVDNLGNTILKNVEFDYVYNADANEDGVIDAVDFKRGFTIPAYGIENGGIKAYEIDKIKLTGAEFQEGEYADSYEALEEILLEVEAGKESKTVEINNLGALQLDDDAMYLLSNLRYATPSFLNSIEITSISKGTLKNVEFKENATVVAGNIVFDSDIEFTSGKSLTINAGAAATIKGGTFTGATVANNGTLTLGASNIVPTIVNGTNSTMVVAANNSIDYTAVSANAPKSLIVNQGVTLTVNSDGVHVFKIAYGQTVTNYGTIYADAAYKFVVNGTVDNYGVINGGTIAGTDAQDGTDQTAVINNYKEIKTIKGEIAAAPVLINQMSETAVIGAATGSGDINNTDNGIVTGTAWNVYAEYEGDQTGKLGDVMAATKVILKSGIWTNPELPTGIKTLELNTVELTRNDNDAITLANVTNLSMKSSTVSKSMTMAAVTSATLEGSTFNAPVEFSALNALNLKAMTINYPLSTIAAAITIQGGASASDVKTTTIAAELTHGTLATLTVNANAKLLVTSNGKLGTDGTTTVTNNGSVENRGHILGDNTTPATGWLGNAVE